MVEDIKKDAGTRMAKSVDALRNEFGKIRTGRANASLLGHVMVSYYGSEVPLNQVATVTVSESPDAGRIPVGEEDHSGHREGAHTLGSRAEPGNDR